MRAVLMLEKDGVSSFYEHVPSLLLTLAEVRFFEGSNGMKSSSTDSQFASSSSLSQEFRTSVSRASYGRERQRSC